MVKNFTVKSKNTFSITAFIFTGIYGVYIHRHWRKITGNFTKRCVIGRLCGFLVESLIMHKAIMENAGFRFEKKEKSGSLKSAGAAAGVLGGLILMLAGMILSAISYFEQRHFNGLEVFLLVGAFVFLGTGTHLLDLMDEDEKSVRIARCKRNGLTDEDGIKYEVTNG